MTCDVTNHVDNHLQPSNIGLRLKPSKSQVDPLFVAPPLKSPIFQVVFEGDALRLTCATRPTIQNELLLRWFHNAKLVTPNVASVTTMPSPRQPLIGGWQEEQEEVESHLFVNSLHADHSGNWTCSALVATGETENATISVVVINHSAVLCPSTVTNTTRGVYRWGVALAGTVSEQDCKKTKAEELFPPSRPRVRYTCEVSGQWGHLNDSQCAHTSNVTEMLFSFAYMNKSDFDQNSLVLVESARQLLKFTQEADKFADGMDIVYLSTVLENYVPYLASNYELASLLVDIAGNVMRMAPHVVSQGQLFGHAATRLIATIANISRIVPAFHHNRASLAVQV